MLIAMQQSAAFVVAAADVKLFSQFSFTDLQLASLAGADVSVQTGDVWIRYDGGGSAANGMLIKAGTIFRLNTRTEVLNCLLYRATSTSATVVATALAGQ